MSDRWRILVAGGLDPETEARLDAVATVVRTSGVNADELKRLIADCDALIARTHIAITREILAAGRKLRVVGVAGVGVDKVDVDAARAFGVEVLNTPGAATDAVADLTLAMMLQLLRPIPQLCDQYRGGHFQAARLEPHGHELRELTVGIVGMGRIGSAVGRRCAAGFGARVLYNDIADVGPFPFAADPASKDEIWGESDVISLHVPLTDETRGLVNRDVLALMKPTALLINTARGPVVDTGALTEALAQRRIGGAGLDVVDPEPLPVEHVLFKCNNCVLTPHIAARTFGGIRRMYAVAEAVVDYLNAGER